MSTERIIYAHEYGQASIRPKMSIPRLVENFYEADEPFKIFAKTTGDEWNEAAVEKEWRARKPLIASTWRKHGLPELSDPEKDCGSFIIDPTGKRLIYTPQREPLHRMRDAYLWGSASQLSLYIHAGVEDIMSDFMEDGYGLFENVNFHVVNMGNNPKIPEGYTKAIKIEDMASAEYRIQADVEEQVREVIRGIKRR